MSIILGGSDDYKDNDDFEKNMSSLKKYKHMKQSDAPIVKHFQDDSVQEETDEPVIKHFQDINNVKNKDKSKKSSR